MSPMCHTASLVLSPSFLDFSPSFPLLSIQTKPSLSELQLVAGLGTRYSVLESSIWSCVLKSHSTQFLLFPCLHTEWGGYSVTIDLQQGPDLISASMHILIQNYDVYKPRWFPPPLLLPYSSTMQAVEIHIRTSRCDLICKSIRSGVIVGTI